MHVFQETINCLQAQRRTLPAGFRTAAVQTCQHTEIAYNHDISALARSVGATRAFIYNKLRYYLL